jgi:hypothetical protein
MEKEINFRKGQKVICVNVSGHSGMQTSSSIKKGGIYTIEDVNKCSCGEPHVFLCKIEPDDSLKYCICGKLVPHDNAFRACRFELVHLNVVK